MNEYPMNILADNLEYIAKVKTELVLKGSDKITGFNALVEATQAETLKIVAQQIRKLL